MSTCITGGNHCLPDTPVVNTDVTKFVEWIHSIVSRDISLVTVPQKLPTSDRIIFPDDPMLGL